MKFRLQQTYPAWLWTEPVEVKDVLRVVTHSPWKSENPAEMKVRLANEARLRTRRLRKLGGEKGRRVTQARISDELLLTREKPHERKVRLKTEWQRRRRAELRVAA